MIMKSRMTVNWTNASKATRSDLVAREAALPLLLIVDWRCQGLFGHDTHSKEERTEAPWISTESEWTESDS